MCVPPKNTEGPWPLLGGTLNTYTGFLVHVSRISATDHTDGITQDRERHRETGARASRGGGGGGGGVSWINVPTYAPTRRRRRRRGAQPAFTNVYRTRAKELEKAIYSPRLFPIRKKDFERASMTGESSRKNVHKIQALASKLSSSACNNHEH